MDITMFVNVLFVVLLICLIFLVFRIMITMDKIDKILDNINSKLNQLDDAFEILGSTSGIIVEIKDKMVKGVTKFLKNIWNRKRGNEDE